MAFSRWVEARFVVLAPKEAEAELRRLLEHDAAKSPTPRTPQGTIVTFADAAEAWLDHGKRKRNLKRSTLRDYRQALDTYLLPPEDPESSDTSLGERRLGRSRYAMSVRAKSRRGTTRCPTAALQRSC